ncbi:MAG TPA: hypothetical protein PKD00_07555 [Burkholderiales bacterium]|nr:hypothetical protein [Burkholderiales bacterium]
MEKKLKGYFTVENIYQKSHKFNKLKSNFELLEQLNIILKQIIPKNLNSCCHIGAFDAEKNLIVLFVNEQPAYHILRNISSNILQDFAKNQFIFDSILIKTSPAYPKTTNKQNSFESEKEIVF